MIIKRVDSTGFIEALAFVSRIPCYILKWLRDQVRCDQVQWLDVKLSAMVNLSKIHLTRSDGNNTMENIRIDS